MRTQHRRSLALAAAATLVSGAALTAAPGAAALSRSGGTTGAVRSSMSGVGTPGPVGTQERRSPVTITVAGFPGTLTAGGPAGEFTATLRNSADHAVDVTTGFVVGNVDSGVRETQLRLDFQPPGGGAWKPAALSPGAHVGATWNLDTFATRLSLPAGGSATYRLRLAVTADAPAGRATGGFTAVVADPTLPPESRITDATGPQQEFTTVAAGPTGTPTSTPAPGVPYLGLDAVPGSFTAGGEAKPFRLTLTNRSGKDVAFAPELTFRGKALPTAEATRLEFQTPDGEWLPATDGGQGAPGRLTLALRAGDRDASLVRLRDGESRTLNVRLAFAQDAPAGVVSLLFTGSSLPVGGGGAGVPAVSSAVDVTVAAAPAALPVGPSTPPAAGGGEPSATVAPPAAAPAAPGTIAPPVGLAAVTPAADPSGPPAPVAASATTQTPPSTAVVPVPAVTVTVAAAPVPSTDLASTGGSAINTPMAVTGATSIAMGIGTLIVAHRRQRARPAARSPHPAGGPAAGPAPRPAGGGPAVRPCTAPGVRPAPGPAAGTTGRPAGPAVR
ncbi:hypothetical protein ACFP3U_07655 [Kitasatospora misakiensis]|uniref:Gram-positive cocci surface proteins LPxTG domain-containing protein n=1 Tax=Kitasatospora misakiensis TaxID=67330 RepID=A0ABW0WZ65_9ACTN